MHKYIEYMLSHLFSSAQGRDDKLFTAGPAFAEHPEPTIELACPEVGPSGSQLHVDHSADGARLFPGLSWRVSSDEIKQYLLVSEDPDVPLPDPIIHGIYYGIAPSVTGVNWEDLELADESDEPYFLKGGFKYGKNRGGSVYIPPQPMRGHGPHRYFFELIALSQLINVTTLSALPTSVEIQGAINGNVVGWGEWVGVYERDWE